MGISMKKLVIIVVMVCTLYVLSGYKVYSHTTFTNADIYNVAGEQGICATDNHFYNNGSFKLVKYSPKMKQQLYVKVKDAPQGINHIGDIATDGQYLYLSMEHYDDATKDHQGTNQLCIGVYDRNTLKYRHSFPLDARSGQKEIAGVAYREKDHCLYLASWLDDKSSQYIYRYSRQGQYLGKYHLQNMPPHIQGLSFYQDELYLTADDGDANRNASDHVYKTKLKDGAKLTQVLTLNNVRDQGEVEGITFKDQKMYVLYVRGTRVVDGRRIGLKKGYQRPVYEIYSYDMHMHYVTIRHKVRLKLEKLLVNF